MCLPVLVMRNLALVASYCKSAAMPTLAGAGGGASCPIKKHGVLTLQAYQFEYSVPSSHTLTVNLPPDAPTGPAQVIVLFPDANNALSQPRLPQLDNIAQYLAWHDEQPASGRSADDVDARIREEHEGWSD